jgi:hypothetical protein
MEAGTSPDKLQSENWSHTKEVKFATQDGIPPTTPAPDTSNELKDLSSPIEDGSLWEKSTAARPNLFKDLRLLMELGMGPEKLVLLTSKSVKILFDEKFSGNDPDNLKL